MLKAMFDAVDEGAQQIHCRNNVLLMLQDFSAVLIVLEGIYHLCCIMSLIPWAYVREQLIEQEQFIV